MDFRTYNFILLLSPIITSQIMGLRSKFITLHLHQNQICKPHSSYNTTTTELSHEFMPATTKFIQFVTDTHRIDLDIQTTIIQTKSYEGKDPSLPSHGINT